LWAQTRAGGDFNEQAAAAPVLPLSQRQLTNLSQILAYLWEFDARCRWGATDMERTVLEKKNDHHLIGYTCKKGSHTGVLNLAPREGVNAALWKRVDDDSLLYIGTPTEYNDRPIQGRLGREKGLASVRAKMPMATSIKEIKPGVCRVVYVNQTDVGGQVRARERSESNKTGAAQ
jgi:hypothetical protein